MNQILLPISLAFYSVFALFLVNESPIIGYMLIGFLILSFCYLHFLLCIYLPCYYLFLYIFTCIPSLYLFLLIWFSRQLLLLGKGKRKLVFSLQNPWVLKDREQVSLLCIMGITPKIQNKILHWASLWKRGLPWPHSHSSPSPSSLPHKPFLPLSVYSFLFWNSCLQNNVTLKMKMNYALPYFCGTIQLTIHFIQIWWMELFSLSFYFICMIWQQFNFLSSTFLVKCSWIREFWRWPYFKACFPSWLWK